MLNIIFVNSLITNINKFMALYWHEERKLLKIMTSLLNIYLMDACRKGDQKAQLRVYKLYFNQMFNVCLKLVNNAVAANEIVRESFLHVFDELNSSRVQADLEAMVRKQVEHRSAETRKRNNVPFPGFITDRINMNNTSITK